MPGAGEAFAGAKDWAVVLPDAREAPVGTWRRCVTQSRPELTAFETFGHRLPLCLVS
eukprot:SAG22_NODE_3830_length_1512_cov_75.643312_2_plen_57_part_00